MTLADGNAVSYRNRACPKCGGATIALPLFTKRRRDPVTCANCGTRLERVLPGAPYYTLALITAILLEAAVPALLILLVVQQWAWIAALVVGILSVNLGVSAFLNARTRVEFVDPADARQDLPGRWYPN